MADPTTPSPFRAVALWGWKDPAWEAVVTDTDGHLQVDVLSAAAVADAATASNQTTIINHLAAINSFTPSVYDTVELSYTGTNLTGVVYKLGGVTVSTLTLTYVGGDLTKVVKS